MNRYKPKWRPDPGDTRSRDTAAIKLSNDRIKLVNARLDSHEWRGLNDWLQGIGAEGWGTGDRSEALAIIRKRLGDAHWRAALDVLAF